MGGTTPFGRSLKARSHQISELLKENVPAFGEAQDIAGDVIGKRGAMDLGYDALTGKMTVSGLAEEIRDHTASAEEDLSGKACESVSTISPQRAIDGLTVRGSPRQADAAMPSEAIPKPCGCSGNFPAGQNREKVKMVTLMTRRQESCSTP